MRYDYECNECGAINELDVSIADKPGDWSPPSAVRCGVCYAKCKRVFGCAIGVQNNSDDTKHIGKATSSASSIQFVGSGFPDVDRRLKAEEDEIDMLMDEPPTREEIAAGTQQMDELERDLGKPKGAISGDREMEEVELIGVSTDEARRVDADAQQRLDGAISATLDKADGPRRVKIAADDIESAKQYKLNNPLGEGEKVVAKIAKRRGKDKLKEEMKSNKANR